jgi:hypothetical protein
MLAHQNHIKPKKKVTSWPLVDHTKKVPHAEGDMKTKFLINQFFALPMNQSNEDESQAVLDAAIADFGAGLGDDESEELWEAVNEHVESSYVLQKTLGAKDAGGPNKFSTAVAFHLLNKLSGMLPKHSAVLQVVSSVLQKAVYEEENNPAAGNRRASGERTECYTMDAAECMRRTAFSERCVQQQQDMHITNPQAQKWQALQKADPVEKVCTVYRLIGKEDQRQKALHQLITTKQPPGAEAENEKLTVQAVVEKLPVGIQEKIHSTAVLALSGEKRAALIRSIGETLGPEIIDYLRTDDAPASTGEDGEKIPEKKGGLKHILAAITPPTRSAAEIKSGHVEVSAAEKAFRKVLEVHHGPLARALAESPHLLSRVFGQDAPMGAGAEALMAKADAMKTAEAVMVKALTNSQGLACKVLQQQQNQQVCTQLLEGVLVGEKGAVVASQSLSVVMESYPDILREVVIAKQQVLAVLITGTPELLLYGPDKCWLEQGGIASAASLLEQVSEPVHQALIEQGSILADMVVDTPKLLEIVLNHESAVLNMFQHFPSRLTKVLEHKRHQDVVVELLKANLPLVTTILRMHSEVLFGALIDTPTLAAEALNNHPELLSPEMLANLREKFEEYRAQQGLSDEARRRWEEERKKKRQMGTQVAGVGCDGMMGSAPGFNVGLLDGLRQRMQLPESLPQQINLGKKGKSAKKLNMKKKQTTWEDMELRRSICAMYAFKLRRDRENRRRGHECQSLPALVLQRVQEEEEATIKREEAEKAAALAANPASPKKKGKKGKSKKGPNVKVRVAQRALGLVAAVRRLEAADSRISNFAALAGVAMEDMKPKAVEQHYRARRYRLDADDKVEFYLHMLSELAAQRQQQREEEEEAKLAAQGKRKRKVDKFAGKTPEQVEAEAQAEAEKIVTEAMEAGGGGGSKPSPVPLQAVDVTLTNLFSPLLPKLSLQSIKMQLHELERVRVRKAGNADEGAAEGAERGEGGEGEDSTAADEGPAVGQQGESGADGTVNANEGESEGEGDSTTPIEVSLDEVLKVMMQAWTKSRELEEKEILEQLAATGAMMEPKPWPPKNGEVQWDTKMNYDLFCKMLDRYGLMYDDHTKRRIFETVADINKKGDRWLKVENFVICFRHITQAASWPTAEIARPSDPSWQATASERASRAHDPADRPSTSTWKASGVI